MRVPPELSALLDLIDRARGDDEALRALEALAFEIGGEDGKQSMAAFIAAIEAIEAEEAGPAGARTAPPEQV